MRHNMEVADLWIGVGESSELMEVRGEKSQCADFLDDMLRDGPSQPKTIVRAGTAAQLIDDDQRLACCGLEDVGSLQHLGHERRDALELRIGCANTRENTVKDGKLRLGAWDEASHLRHQRDDT